MVNAQLRSDQVDADAALDYPSDYRTGEVGLVVVATPAIG